MSWKRFKHGDLKVTAKVFNGPSNDGIKNGRISKLEIRTKGGKMVANYDRGWDVRPKKASHKAALKAALKKYPNKTKKKKRKR